MSPVQTVKRIEYPESDGKPMGETDLHREWMCRILDILRWRYRRQRVYLASNVLVYYEEGDPAKYVVPDDFVVKDCEPRRRRTFKIWREARVPDVVFEVTSRGSRREDQAYKPQVYARMGVKEYFLYDPTDEYLKPSLQGFRFDCGIYTRIQPDETGALACDELDITLRLAKRNLVMSDRRSGEVLHTEAEAERAGRKRAVAARRAAETARQEAEAARQAEIAARKAAEARAAELEAELRRLRDQRER